MGVAIKAHNLSKAYQLGEIGTGTISRDLERWFAKIRGKEDPFLRIGETNDRTSKGNSDIVWSLKDINFEIEQGDAVGIIGRNGAGKSTLLKILSKVTSPTTGKVSGKGRIASLLEVGTGFHPELTGRENIYLNGAILGMRKREIKKHFDAIVDFAGVERYIDTPVKRYSSGMYVRLAFAVAAHLESEILIVDEVLAVGDAEFQKKCLGKMGEVSKGEGRTVLFVSHNMASIMSLCNKGILLKNGTVEYSGTAFNSVKNYTSENLAISRQDLLNRRDRIGNGSIRFKTVTVQNQSAKCGIRTGDTIIIKLEFTNNLQAILNSENGKLRIDLNISNSEGFRILQVSNYYLQTNQVLLDKHSTISFRVENVPLVAGNYYGDIYSKVDEDEADWINNAFVIEIEENDVYKSGKILSASNSLLALDYSLNIS